MSYTCIATPLGCIKSVCGHDSNVALTRRASAIGVKTWSYGRAYQIVIEFAKRKGFPTYCHLYANTWSHDRDQQPMFQNKTSIS